QRVRRQRHGMHFVRHVARAALFAQTLADRLVERLVKDDAVLQLHEQRHVEATIRLLDADDQAVLDLFHALKGTVDLGRADAHAKAVQRRVRTTVDEATAPAINFHEVAVTPDTRIGVEIRFLVLLELAVAPEEQRHARHRAGNNQFAYLVDHRIAGVVKHPNVDAEAWSLNFSGVN